MKKHKTLIFGEHFDKEKIMNCILENHSLKGITISGGEPLCKENVPHVLDFLKEIKTKNTKLARRTGIFYRTGRCW